MFNIWAQSYSTGSYSIPTDFAADLPVELDLSSATLYPDKAFPPGHTGEDSNVELDPPLVLPAPDKTLYSVYPVEGDYIGSLTIPALKLELPIIHETGADELKKGVGHFTQSVLPGKEDNSVLSGHRDTVFAKLGELMIGDQLIVQTADGTFTYEVKGTRIVDKDDKTVIVPTDNAVLTLTTCYRFRFVGNAPDRYIVSADLVISK